MIAYGNGVLAHLLLFIIHCYWGIVVLYRVLVSALQQGESAVHVHMAPLLWISFPFRSPESFD